MMDLRPLLHLRFAQVTCLRALFGRLNLKRFLQMMHFMSASVTECLSVSTS